MTFQFFISHLLLLFFPIQGFAANTPNLYNYASNNPLVVKDPSGEIAPFLVVAGLGALKGVAGYVLTTPPSKYTAGG